MKDDKGCWGRPNEIKKPSHVVCVSLFWLHCCCCFFTLFDAPKCVSKFKQHSLSLSFELFKVLHHSSLLCFCILIFRFRSMVLLYSMSPNPLPFYYLWIAKRKTTTWNYSRERCEVPFYPLNVLDFRTEKFPLNRKAKVLAPAPAGAGYTLAVAFPRYTFPIWICYIIYKVEFDNNAMYSYSSF